jgi:outer membrane protein assembly factor BamB
MQKMKGFKLSITLLVIVISLFQLNLLASAQVLSISTSTDKQLYNIGEQVNISTTITLDGNSINHIAAVEVDNPYGNPYIIRTIATGNVSDQWWRVQIKNVYTCDSFGNPQTTFSRGQIAYVSLTIKNTDNYNSYNLLVALFAQSSQNTPILAFYPHRTTIQAGQQLWLMAQLPIPNDAPTGEAKLYASLFTDLPKAMGYPYCPENKTTFYISTTTPTMPPQPQYSNITFNFPQGNITAGEYTIYATAHYQVQTKISIKKFTLNGPVAVVAYNPKNPIVCQTVTFNGSGSYSPYGTITEWKWNFGDGITKDGAIVVHAYDTAKKYKLNLRLIDSKGVESTSYYEITVSEAWPMYRHDTKHYATSTSLSPTINETKWSKVIGSTSSDEWMFPSPIVVPTAFGNIVFTASNNTVYALNASNAQTIWSKPMSTTIHSSPAYTEGTLFIGADDAKIYAINATNGQIIYTITTGGAVYSSPTIHENIIYVGSTDCKVYAFNLSGITLWTSPTLDGAIYTSPAIANGKVYVATSNGTIYALNETTGSVIWSKTLSLNKPVYSSPTVAYGKIYIGSTDNRIYALNTENGAIMWNITTGGEVFSSPAVMDGIIFIGSLDGNIYAINASNGSLIWKKTVGAIKWASPSIAEKKVFIGTTDGKLYALKEDDGTTWWTYKTDGTIDSSPALLSETVFITSKNGRIYAISGQSHNIAITQITPSKTLVKYTETVTINVNLWNKGSYSETAIITSYCDGTPFFSGSITIPRGIEIVYPILLETTTLSEGNHTLLVNATLSQPGTDIDISDNTKTCQIRIEYADIGMLQVVPSTPGVKNFQQIPAKTVIGKGCSTTIYLTIENEGNFTENNIQVTVYWSNNTHINYTIITLIIPQIPTKTTITVNFTWNTSGLTYGNYTISAYANPVQGEIHTADNSKVFGMQIKIGVPGDISSIQPGKPDGVVNMRDVTYCILLFNTKPDSPNWKPNADINNDGVVNMRDVTIIILHFNQKES